MNATHHVQKMMGGIILALGVGSPLIDIFADPTVKATLITILGALGGLVVAFIHYATARLVAGRAASRASALPEPVRVVAPAPAAAEVSPAAGADRSANGANSTNGVKG